MFTEEASFEAIPILAAFIEQFLIVNVELSPPEIALSLMFKIEQLLIDVLDPDKSIPSLLQFWKTQFSIFPVQKSPSKPSEKVFEIRELESVKSDDITLRASSEKLLENLQLSIVTVVL